MVWPFHLKEEYLYIDVGVRYAKVTLLPSFVLLYICLNLSPLAGPFSFFSTLWTGQDGSVTSNHVSINGGFFIWSPNIMSFLVVGDGFSFGGYCRLAVYLLETGVKTT